MENPQAEESLFRKKSIDRISSPEQLHDYMRVTGPRLWMILAAIVILLGGFIIYASTATMENKVPIRVQLVTVTEQVNELPEGEAREMTYVISKMPMSMKDSLKTGMAVRFGGEEGHISWYSVDEGEDGITVMFDMKHSYIPMEDGEYDAELVLEATTPISFLWN